MRTLCLMGNGGSGGCGTVKASTGKQSHNLGLQPVTCIKLDLQLSASLGGVPGTYLGWNGGIQGTKSWRGIRLGLLAAATGVRPQKTPGQAHNH